MLSGVESKQKSDLCKPCNPALISAGVLRIPNISAKRREKPAQPPCSRLDRGDLGRLRPHVDPRRVGHFPRRHDDKVLLECG